MERLLLNQIIKLVIFPEAESDIPLHINSTSLLVSVNQIICLDTQIYCNIYDCKLFYVIAKLSIEV